jgi:hypothetical protein
MMIAGFGFHKATDKAYIDHVNNRWEVILYVDGKPYHANVHYATKQAAISDLEKCGYNVIDISRA